MTSAATPRVLFSSLSTLVGRDVLLVGQVLDASGNVILKTADGKSVTVHSLNPPAYSTTFVEVLGTVNPDLSITEKRVTRFGGDFNLETYKAMLTVSELPAHNALFV
eukprot:c39763_g1_i1.p2 GENE.c39763_g1_i1~~c39763_g1_i1.p2  ORF type:complete len:116 (-),score=18.80 c39763_g1_i1:86-406(-)